MKDNIQNERRQHNEDEFISEQDEKQFLDDFVDLCKECFWAIVAIIAIAFVCHFFE